MKKVIFNLLIIGFVFMMPFVVWADENTTGNTTGNNTVNETVKVAYPNNPITFKQVGKDVVDETNKTTTRTYEIYVATTNEVELDTAKIIFSYAADSATKSIDCGDAGIYKVSDKSSTTNPLTCTFEVPEGTDVNKAKTFKVGTLTQVIETNGKNCDINYQIGTITGKINPNTGISIPYAYIIGGIVLAGAIYFTTQKKNKMYKI